MRVSAGDGSNVSIPVTSKDLLKNALNLPSWQGMALPHAVQAG
jgi:hypothetical protein